MNAKICDRCGKVYDNYGRVSEPSNVRTLYYRNYPFGMVDIKEYDLCKDCMRELTEFLGEGGKILNQNSYDEDDD